MIPPIGFYSLAIITIACALAVVSVKNVFHAGLFLIGTFLGVAGIYASLQNFFLAAVQLLIYSGAIAVLILFGIMMTQRLLSKSQPVHNPLWFVGILLSAGILTFLILALSTLSTGALTVTPTEDLLRGIGQTLLQRQILAFEIISVVLLAALIGAVAVAKGKE